MLREAFVARSGAILLAQHLPSFQIHFWSDDCCSDGRLDRSKLLVSVLRQSAGFTCKGAYMQRGLYAKTVADSSCVGAFVICICGTGTEGTPNDLRGFLYPEQDIVSIYGDAQETAYADVAILSLVVTTENKLLSKSLSKNAEIRKAITDSLIRSGVTADKIKSSEFSSSPEYGWFSREPTSHKVVNRMAIEITQESQLMDAAVFADRYDEVALADTAFKHSKKEAYNVTVQEKLSPA